MANNKTIQVTSVKPAQAQQPAAQAAPPATTAVAQVEVLSPDFFAAPKPVSQSEALSSFEAPYSPTYGWVNFVHPGTKTVAIRDSFVAAGGDLAVPGFMLTENGVSQLLKPFKAHLFDYKLMYTLLNNNNKIIGVTLQKPDKKQYDEGYRLHYQVLLGVKTGDAELQSIRPATFNFRGPMARGIENAIKLLEQVKQPAQVNEHGVTVVPSGLSQLMTKGPGFRAAAEICPYPSGVFHFLSSARIEPVPNDTQGKTMKDGQCTISPSSQADVRVFLGSLKNPNWMKDFVAARNGFQNKVKLLMGGEAAEDAEGVGE